MLPKVAILCGGRGTRLQAHSPALPKPLVEIGGRPILWHVIQIYLAQGFCDDKGGNTQGGSDLRSAQALLSQFFDQQ